MFEKELIDLLIDNNFPTAIVIEPRDSGVNLYKGTPYLVYEWIEGIHKKQISFNQQCQILEAMAQLHLITIDKKIKYAEDRLSYNKKEITHRLKSSVALDTEDAENKLKWWEAEIDKLELPDELTKGICHTDYHYSNILFKNTNFKSLIDFDDANFTYLFFDIVSYLPFFKSSFNHVTWSNHDSNKALDFSRAKELLCFYQNKITIPESDKRHFYDLLKLSILIDTVWYFDRGDSQNFFEKRKIDILNQLGKEKFYSQLFL